MNAEDFFVTLGDYGRPAESEARFQELLPAAEPFPAIYAEIATQIARAQGLQRRFEEAHRTLDLTEYEVLGERSGYVREEIDECLLLLGDETAARPHLAEAYEMLSADPWLVANEPARLERLRRLAGDH